MYKEFYGLKESPFNATPDPQFLYFGENHREALAQLLYGLKERKGFIVITGEVGTGKTTLIHYLLERLNGTSQVRSAFLFHPKLTVHDFLEYILRDLGVNEPGTSKGESLHRLHQSLLDSFRRDERVLLIVDEAQGLRPALLEEIRLLSNLETAKSKLLQIVLVGQPELNDTLWRSEFRQLRQRINLRFHLPPLSARESREYILKRLRVAGAARPLFTEGAMQEVYRSSRGVPRLINIICDNSLLNGYALDQRVVERETVREAARLLRLSQSGPFPVRLGVFLIILLAVAAGTTLAALGFLEPIWIEGRQALEGLLQEAARGLGHFSPFR